MSRPWYNPIILAICFSPQQLTVMEGVQGTGGVKSNFLLWPSCPTWEQQWGKPWSQATSEDVSGNCPGSGQGHCWSLRSGSFSGCSPSSVHWTFPDFTPSLCRYPVFTASSKHPNPPRFPFFFPVSSCISSPCHGRLWQACQGHLHLKWKMNWVLIPVLFCLPWK